MKNLLFFLLFSVVITGCKDDDADPLPFENQVELLAGKKNESKTWIVESVTVNGTGLDLEACDADNIFTFYNNDLQEYKLTFGALKCDPAHPTLLEEGTWMFSTDGKMLIISANKTFHVNVMNYFGTLTSKPGKVVTLTATNFKTEINVVDGVGGDAVNTVISLKTN
ncbi:MAG: hypothetical protein C0490_10675 [Marivirga sp.]|nr:hypothetical protein [Marivirga sp.]